ncbi:MAG: zf-HC2 domain-containing protein [Syntrophomonas sp.]
MKCEQIRSLLSPYIDGMTDNKEKQVVEAHLAVCPECRKQKEDYLSLCEIMHKMDTHQVPEQFSADLHRRLLDEQNKIWGTYPFKTPKKSGWIAAGLAVIALTAGIYSSSFVPLGKYVTAWYDKGQTDPQKPVLSIDNIIERFQNWNQENDKDQAELAQENSNETGGNDRPMAKKSASSGGTTKVASQKKVIVTTIKVDSIEDSLTQVKNIADNSGLEYTLIPGDSSLQSTSTGGTTRQVILNVDQKDTEQVILELENVGSLQVDDPSSGDDGNAGISILSSPVVQESQPVESESLENQPLGNQPMTNESVANENEPVEGQPEEAENEQTAAPDNSDAVKEENPEQGQDIKQEQPAKQNNNVTITVNLIEEKEE